MATSGLSAGRYLLGLVSLAVILGSLGFAAVRIRRRALPQFTGAPALLAALIIAFALLVAVLQLLGAVGAFELAPILLVAVLIGFISWHGFDEPARIHARAAPRDPRGLVVAATAAAAAVTAEWTGPTLISYDHGIRTFDSLWYHLPWAAGFAHTGSILGLRFTDVEYLTAFYPATAELFHGLGIVALGGDVLSPALNLGFLGMLLLGAWCCGRPFGVAPLTLLAGTAAMAMPMLLLSQAGSAANDVVGVCFLMAAVAMLLSAPDEPSALVLAAVAAGLAVSTKLSLLAPVAALTIGLLVWRRTRRVSALWLVPLLLAGGFWYLRNLIAVGNPLPWVNLPGLAVPAAPLQAHTGFSIVHYLGQTTAWQGLLEPGLASGLGGWWWAVLVAVLAGPILCLTSRRAEPRVRLAGAVALVSLLAYLLTPETAAGPPGHPFGFAFNLRYSAPALTLCLVALALAPVWRRPRAALALGGALTLLLVVTLARSRLWPNGYIDGQILVAVLGLLGAGLLRSRPALPARLRHRFVITAAGALAVLVFIGLGFSGQRHYFRVRYSYARGISSLSHVWARFRTVRDARVGIVGTYGGFFAYPLAGIDDSNTVVYIGDRGRHGSFTPVGSCRAWREAVNAADLQLLVTTPARDPWHPRTLSPSPERGWTISDPHARPIDVSHAAGQPITVFRIGGRLNPAACR